MGAARNIAPARAVLYALLGITLFALVVVAYFYTDLELQLANGTQVGAKTKGQYAVQQLTYKLSSGQRIAQWLAQDMTQKALTGDALTQRLRDDLKDNPVLFGITVAFADKSKPLAPTVLREGDQIKVADLGARFNYADEKPSSRSTAWYSRVKQTGQPFWADPFREPLTDALVVSYSVPFFSSDQSEQLAGVVVVYYSVAFIKDAVVSLGVDSTGYAFIVSADGTYIYHPYTLYVKEGSTVEEIAQQTHSKTLHTFVEQRAKHDRGLMHHISEVNGRPSWLYYQAVPIADWTLAITYSAEEVLQPLKTLRQYRVWLVVLAVLAMLLLVTIFSGVTDSWGSGKKMWSALASVTLAFGLSVLWSIVYLTSSYEYSPKTVIYGTSSLERFLERVQVRLQQAHEPMPLTVPTGIFIHSLELSTPQSIEISGYVWQKIDRKLLPNFTPGVTFPQATDLTLDEAHHEKDGSIESIGWNVRATLTQNFSYQFYPFDEKRIVVTMEPKDIKTNVLLVPDLSGYMLTNPSSQPGIDDDVALSGFEIQKSFFSFAPEHPLSNLGVAAREQRSPLLSLRLNILTTRHLLHAFVVYLLPLIVALFAMFAAMWLMGLVSEKTQPFSSLSAFTGLFFAVVILQRTLRTKLAMSEMFYIEYFFFSTYFTILFLVIYDVFRISGLAKTKFHQYLIYLFWPVQLGVWFVITALLFHH